MPVPTPEAIPKPSATPTPSASPAFTFIVGIDKYTEFSRVSLNAFSGVVRNCADRLDDSLLVKAETASKDLSRGEAVRKAKEEKTAYVVWLRLRQDNMSGDTGIYDDPYDVYIEYTVLAPVTAEQVNSGNVYPKAYQNKRIRLPTPQTQGDYLLNQAARGVAERILAHFHLRLPNTTP